MRMRNKFLFLVFSPLAEQSKANEKKKVKQDDSQNNQKK